MVVVAMTEVEFASLVQLVTCRRKGTRVKTDKRGRWKVPFEEIGWVMIVMKHILHLTPLLILTFVICRPLLRIV
jgi:hypothetical protein